MLAQLNQPGRGCMPKVSAKPQAEKPFLLKWVNPAIVAKAEADKKAAEERAKKPFLFKWVNPKLAKDEPKVSGRGHRRQRKAA